MDLDDAFRALRVRNEPVPRPLTLPTAQEVADAERRLGLTFHPDFRRYLLEVSDVICGTKETVTITRPESHTDLFRVAKDAWACGVPRDRVPICADNGDYFCVLPTGEVAYLSHNGFSSETWPDLADWIEKVWLGEG